MQKGDLYLIPTLLGDGDPHKILSGRVLQLIGELRHYIVEDIRSARRFLSNTGIAQPINEISFFELNKQSSDESIANYLNDAISGHNMGLLSEAGMPCIADPGSKIVAMAHNKGIRVVPLPGPSSILLALTASGLNGQNFVFHGYLPVKKDLREKRLKIIEKESVEKNQSQIFMETPYRNNQILESVYTSLKASTLLTIACDLTLPHEFIRTDSIENWKRKKPDIHKRPAIFIIQG